MLINAIIPGVQVIKKKSFQGKAKDDGSRNTYYQLLIDTDQDAGEVNCTQSVFDMIKEYSIYDLFFTVNNRFDRIYIRIDKAVEVKTK